MEEQEKGKDLAQDTGKKIKVKISSEDGKAAKPEKPPERRRKYIPAILMLFGGAVGSFTTFYFGYDMNVFLGVTLLCLILFHTAGSLYVYMLDRFDEQIEKARLDEGEVIEKDEEPHEDDQDGSENPSEE